MANSLHAVLSPTVVLVHWNFAAQMAIHFYEYLPLFLQIWSASRLMRLFGASFSLFQSPPALARALGHCDSYSNSNRLQVSSYKEV